MSSVPSLRSRRTNPVDPSLWDIADISDVMDLLAANRQPINVTEHVNILVDWKETPEAHIFEADIPGLTKENVKIEVEESKRILQVSGELSKPEESVDGNIKFHRLERQHGTFWRRFMLPENAKLDEEVKAKMEKGVLTITIPKKPDQVRRVRFVEISG